MATAVTEVVLGAEPGVSTIDDLPSRSRKFFASLELWLPLGVLVVMAFFCFIWPLIYAMPSPSEPSLLQANIAPFSPHHILGTDPLGVDEMSQILYGGRISLEVGFGVAFLGLVIGGTIGMVAGFAGGIIDTLLMRILDVFLAFPALVLAIAIVTYLGQSELHVIWAISFFAIPAFARLARAETLSLRERIYIAAARLSGSGNRRILVRHIAPAVFPTLLTFSLLGVAISIIIESGLSFLGLGVPAEVPSWGKMIAVGQTYIASSPHLVIIPGIFLFVTVVALNLSGDALRARWGAR
jgi:peptide/nickel transport system permease protein